MWIVDVVRDVLAYRRGVRVHKGDRVRALVDIEVGGLIYYRAPFSTGFRCRIPRGGVLRIYAEPTSWLFACTADDPSLEAAIVPQSELQHPAYAGHAVELGLSEIGRRLELLPRRAGATND